jgi:hypothetical protein
MKVRRGHCFDTSDHILTRMSLSLFQMYSDPERGEAVLPCLMSKCFVTLVEILPI